MDKKRELRFDMGLKLAAHKEFEKDHSKIICESLNKESEEELIKIQKKFKYNLKRIYQENIFAY